MALTTVPLRQVAHLRSVKISGATPNFSTETARVGPGLFLKDVGEPGSNGWPSKRRLIGGAAAYGKVSIVSNIGEDTGECGIELVGFVPRNQDKPKKVA